MPDRERDMTLKELGEVSEKHRASRERAAHVAQELEAHNDKLRDVIAAYRRANEALEESRNGR